jgi:transposase
VGESAPDRYRRDLVQDRTSLKILTIVGDGSAFPSAAHLAAYAGLSPVTRRSGSSIKGETRSQRGNHALKNALFQSAFASLTDPTSRAYYDRKRAEKKKHNAPGSAGPVRPAARFCLCSR